MLYDPAERVTVMSAFGRSRITVTVCPEVVPVPEAPRSLGVGSGPVASGGNCPGEAGGTIAGCPLFQFASVPQSPLPSCHQTAGISWSFRYSRPPWTTSRSRLLFPLLKLFSRPTLVYCQKTQGWVTP